MNKQLKERFSEAVKLKKGGKFAPAKKVLLSLARRNPKSKIILVTLGDTYWELGALEKAVQVFRCATKVAPQWEVASKGLFHVLWDLGRRVEAMKELVRFQSVSDSKDYRRIVKEINAKYSELGDTP